MNGKELHAVMRETPREYAQQLIQSYDTLTNIKEDVKLTRRQQVESCLTDTVNRMRRLSRGCELAAQYIENQTLTELKKSLDARIADYK